MTERTELYFTPRRIAELTGKIKRSMSTDERKNVVRTIREALRKAGVLVERLGVLVVSAPDLARVLPETAERLYVECMVTGPKGAEGGRRGHA